METATLSLYHYQGCPFCEFVGRAIDRLGIQVELRDIQRDPTHRNALVEATGRMTVPCLRIEESPGEVRWIHESVDIIRFLEAREAAA